MAQRLNAILFWVCVAVGLLALTGCVRADDDDISDTEGVDFDLSELLVSIGWKMPVGALVGVIGANVLAPIMIRIIGFRSKGVRPGSLGSVMMSMNRGRVTSGGMVARLQRAGAAGIGMLGKSLLAGFGAVAGTYIASMYDK